MLKLTQEDLRGKLHNTDGLDDDENLSVCVIAHKDPNKPVYLHCFIIHLVYLYVPHPILNFKFYSSTTGRTLYLHLVKLDK